MIRKTNIIYILILILFHLDLMAEIFYLSPSGNDVWSGCLENPNGDKSDGPLLTLQAARNKIRLLKRQGSLTEPIYVKIKDGCYQMTKPLVLTPADSGTADCPIVYTAQEGSKPVFTGGRIIKGFKHHKDGIWTACLPQVKSGNWNFNQLFVNGRRAVRARTPNKDYYYVAGKYEKGVDPTTGKIEDLKWRAFKVYPDDIKPLYEMDKTELSSVVAVLYHSWEVDRSKIAAIASEKNALIIQGDITWSLQHFGKNQRYHLENYKAALDIPGEWFLDLEGVLSYKPLSSEDMENAKVVAPEINEFISFKGCGEINSPVEYITIQGLTFEYADYNLSQKGSFNVQGADFTEAVITADWASNITIKECQIAHIGTHAIWFRHGCINNSVESCYLYDLGAGGIRLGQCWSFDDELRRSNPSPESHKYTGYITVNNNIIRSGGQVFMGASGILVGHSGNNQITHNDICDFCHSGISVGWRWDYKLSVAINNIVEYNHIHHLGRDVLSDFGGIYTLGVSDGTKIKYNFIHDLSPYNLYGLGGYGIYNDQGSSFIVVEKNLVVNAVEGSYMCNYGKENRIQNNIFINSQKNQLFFCRAEEHLSFIFKNNIIYFTSGELLEERNKSWSKGNVFFDSNIYYSPNKFTFAEMSFDQWKKLGRDKNSLIINPCFNDFGNLDYKLDNKSPAYGLGFKKFDHRKAGVYGDSEWLELAKKTCLAEKSE